MKEMKDFAKNILLLSPIVIVGGILLGYLVTAAGL